VKVIELEKEAPQLLDLLRLARQEPILLVTADGEAFVVSEADDFDFEVEQLRSSVNFQRFLDARSSESDTLRIDELESLLDAEADNTDSERSNAPDESPEMFARSIFHRKGSSPDTNS